MDDLAIRVGRIASCLTDTVMWRVSLRCRLRVSYIREVPLRRASWSIDAMPPHVRTVAVISALAAFTMPGVVQTPHADSIIVNAKVFTGVFATPWAEALSVIDDRIGVVGTTAAVRKVAGRSTRVSGTCQVGEAKRERAEAAKQPPRQRSRRTARGASAASPTSHARRSRAQSPPA